MFYLFAIACLALDGSRRDLSSWSVPANAIERLHAFSFDTEATEAHNSEVVQGDARAREIQNTASHGAVEIATFDEFYDPRGQAPNCADPVQTNQS